MVVVFSDAFGGRTAQEGISRRIRRVMLVTEGSTMAARYMLKPASGIDSQGWLYDSPTMNSPTPVAPVKSSFIVADDQQKSERVSRSIEYDEKNLRCVYLFIPSHCRCSVWLAAVERNVGGGRMPPARSAEPS